MTNVIRSAYYNPRIVSVGSMMQARYINRAIDKYKYRWGMYPVNTDAFIDSLFDKGVNLAIAVGH